MLCDPGLETTLLCLQKYLSSLGYAPGPQSGYEILEEENDRKVASLSSKVAQLKSVSLKISTIMSAALSTFELIRNNSKLSKSEA